MLSEDGTWTNYSDWEFINSLVSFNLETERITIYEDPRRTFDIISSVKSISEDGDEVLTMECLGHNETECLFTILIDPEENIQFYINYGEAILAYNAIFIE